MSSGRLGQLPVRIDDEFVCDAGVEGFVAFWRLRPDLPAAPLAALQRETRTIPIVFVAAADPVASSIVPRLDRPSGNITGFATLEASLGGKWLELLSEIAPGLKRAAIMFNPDTAPVPAYMPSFETAAGSLKVELMIAPVHGEGEIETAIIGLGREPGGGLSVSAHRPCRSLPAAAPVVR
jgi:putative ABC transport system substrate-binding protein